MLLPGEAVVDGESKVSARTDGGEGLSSKVEIRG